MGNIAQSQFLILPKRLQYIKAETTGHLRCLHNLLTHFHAEQSTDPK